MSKPEYTLDETGRIIRPRLHDIEVTEIRFERHDVQFELGFHYWEGDCFILNALGCRIMSFFLIIFIM